MTKAAQGRRAAAAPVAVSSGALQVTAGKDESAAQALARLALSPSFQACATTRSYLSRLTGDLDVNAMHGEVIRQAEMIKAGNLMPAELMLFDQALSLQAIFASFADRAAVNAGEYLGAAETYLRLALKAQSQCRATLETLAAIKNPQPTAFIRQQNIANNQQVNNGTAAPAASPGAAARTRVEDSDIPANELLAVTNEQGQRLDSGAATAAGGGDPAMAPLDAGHRP